MICSLKSNDTDADKNDDDEDNYDDQRLSLTSNGVKLACTQFQCHSAWPANDCILHYIYTGIFLRYALEKRLRSV